MGIYIRDLEVRERLRGKVKFTDDPEQLDYMSVRLLRRLIIEGESAVELALSERYGAPFQTLEGQPFQSLPERPTKEFIRTLCELKACIRVLEEDFGRGAVKGDDFKDKLEKRYDKMITDHLARRSGDEGQNQYKMPPLPGLRKNYHNDIADDGYRGMVINSSSLDNSADYASNQVNDPSLNWLNYTTEDIYGKD